MKSYCFLLAFLLICFFPTVSHAQKLTVGTYNIRLDIPGDTANLWSKRAPAVVALIRFHDFDVLGTQEGFSNQLDDITRALPEYARYGKGRDDGKDKGEHSAILYRKDRFKLLDKGDFWLSETPDKPSLGWDATCCKRICSWVYLQDLETGNSFYFFNAHYDHEGMQARRESSKLILSRIKQIAGEKPIILAGDFNGDHGSEWYRSLENSAKLQDTYLLVENPYANNASFNGFKSEVKGTGIIDHVFVSDDFITHRWGLLTDTYRGKFPSDHFPVLVELSYIKPK